ncbi:MAG: hypothetical protein RL021_1912, partial [Bacteroidota bacterium]
LMSTATSLPVWVTAEGPYGFGNSSLRVCAAAGNLSFPATWLDLEFPITTLDTFVVSRIDCQPNLMPFGSSVYSDAYWVVDRYGVPAVPVFDYVFRLPAGTVGQSDEASPSNLQLYNRDGFDIGPWSPLIAASWASVAQSTVRFPVTQTTGQLIIGTVGNSILEVPDLVNKFVEAGKVFPNPAADEFRIRLSMVTSDEIPVRLVDVSGRAVINVRIPPNEREVSVQLGSVHAGYYRLEFFSHGYFFSQPLMVLEH